ncbi:MAG TPA: ester cyclase [Gaiellaceae bacterium]|jgi:steroid delta-isomerase-like uncharacterized protein
MADSPTSVLRRFYEGVNAGEHVSVIDEIVSEDLVEHESFPGVEPSKEGVKQVFSAFRSAFPDFHIEVHETLDDGDLGCARIVSTGTHEGEFLGIPATGNRIELETIDIIRVRDGKAVEHWGLSDGLAMMVQLGVIEPPSA